MARMVWRDALAVIADAPQEFTFGSATFTGTISGLNKRKTLEIGGFDEGPELTLMITIKDASYNNQFTNRPQVGDRITIDGTTYRVDRTEVDPFIEVLQLDLRSQNK